MNFEISLVSWACERISKRAVDCWAVSVGVESEGAMVSFVNGGVFG